MKKTELIVIVTSIVLAACIISTAILNWELMLLAVSLFLCFVFSEASLAVLYETIEFIKNLIKRK